MVQYRKLPARFCPAFIIKAGKYGYRQDLWSRTSRFFCCLGGSSYCRFYHFAAPCSMDSDQVSAQSGNGSDAVFHRIRNIMKFQIKKYMFPLFLQIGDSLTACAVEQFHSHFVKRDRITKHIDNILHFIKRIYVQCNNDPVICCDTCFVVHAASPLLKIQFSSYIISRIFIELYKRVLLINRIFYRNFLYLRLPIRG